MLSINELKREASTYNIDARGMEKAELVAAVERARAAKALNSNSSTRVDFSRPASWAYYHRP